MNYGHFQEKNQLCFFYMKSTISKYFKYSDQTGKNITMYNNKSVNSKLSVAVCSPYCNSNTEQHNGKLNAHC